MPIDVDEAQRLLTEEGLNCVEIADRLGFTPAGVRLALKKIGCQLHPSRRIFDEQWGERMYTLWRSVVRRCSTPGHRLYHRYGAKGISVCREWDSFWPFYDWAIKGYRPGLNLVLVGRSRRFSPKTCSWITAQERMERDGYPGGRKDGLMISAFGQTKSTAAWVRDKRCKITADTLRSRLKKGVPPEEAMTLPVGVDLPKDASLARPTVVRRERLDWQRIVELHVRSELGVAEIARQVDSTYSTIRHGLQNRGVLRSPKLIGLHSRRLRRVWDIVRRHCENESAEGYCYYGARGARLCKEWRDFRRFYEWGIESGYEPGLCLTRKGGALVYSPKNCFWATLSETNAKAAHRGGARRARWEVSAFGESKGPTAWARDSRCQVTSSGLIRRLRAGWPVEDAIKTPRQQVGLLYATLLPVDAFGETKSVAAWARDPRCKVSAATLCVRLRRGVSPEAAIATPPYQLKAGRPAEEAR